MPHLAEKDLKTIHEGDWLACSLCNCPQPVKEAYEGDP